MLLASQAIYVDRSHSFLAVPSLVISLGFVRLRGQVLRTLHTTNAHHELTVITVLVSSVSALLTWPAYLRAHMHRTRTAL